VKLFLIKTISLILSAVMLHFAVAGPLYAQNLHFAANTKITPHEPVIIIRDTKKIGDDDESWFSKYKWWLLAGLVVVGGGAAAAGGGGGSSSNGGGGGGGEGGTISFGW
jgi:uncharacterized membrane protein YgcG